MVSLFKSVKVAELTECVEALTRITNLLVQGIRLHAVCAAQPLHQNFETMMRQHEHQVEEAGCDPETLMRCVGAIHQSMHSYARESEASIEAGRQELQAIVVMLTRSLTRLLSGNDVSIASLQTFERRLGGVTQIDDIRTVKGELEQCLKSVQAEVRRQNDERVQLQQTVQSVTQNPAVLTSFAERHEDPTTGLPSMTAARKRIAAAFQAQEDIYVVPLRVDNLPIINGRYGREAGDTFLVEATQLLAQGLKSGDTLYRWGGPCLLAVLAGRTSPEAVRSEIDRLTSRAREHAVTLSGRSVIFKIAVSSLGLRALRSSDLEMLIAQIDAFVYKERK